MAEMVMKVEVDTKRVQEWLKGLADGMQQPKNTKWHPNSIDDLRYRQGWADCAEAFANLVSREIV